MRIYQQPYWVNPVTARAFLENLANLPEPRRALINDLPEFRQRVGILARQFSRLFDELRPLLTDQGRAPGLVAKGANDSFVIAIVGLSTHVRAVWKVAQKPREAEWIIFELRQLYHRLSCKALSAHQASEFNETTAAEDHAFHDALSKAATQKAERYIFWGWWPNSPPPLTAFEQVMYQFQRMRRHARECGNANCRSPYFFAHKRRRYCGEECARQAKSEYKRNWWDEKGRKRRQQQQAAKQQRSYRRPKQ